MPSSRRGALRSLADAIDVAFLALHGPFGEDGTLQGFLEMAGIPYTGAGVMASAVAMDKVVFKDLMRGHDLPVVSYTWFRRSAWTDAPGEVLQDVGERIGPRSVVKPARLGSSVGMTLVHGAGELPAALDEAFRYDSKVLVEAYLANARELECGVLGNDQPIVFEPGEVRSHREWYDYAAKYTEGLADVIPRAEVEPELAARVKDLSLGAYRAVDCAGMARVDFLVSEGAAYIWEMNTIPGFTTTSMFPKQAELAGIGFRELIARLIELGLERRPRGAPRNEPHHAAPAAPLRRATLGAPATAPPAGGRLPARARRWRCCSRSPRRAGHAVYGPWLRVATVAHAGQRYTSAASWTRSLQPIAAPRC